MPTLEGKVAIITGAGGGIGREYARLFASEGASVVVNDIGCKRDGSGDDGLMAEAVVREIEAAGGRAVANSDSVTTRDGVDRLMWLAINKFGRLDIVVNNAGILRDRSLLNMSEAEWDAVQEVHMRGTFLVTQAAARWMRHQGNGGRIINTTSVSGLQGNFGQSNYGAAKAGIAGFTFTCAKELARYGIAVNAIAPIALTRMTDDLPQKEDSKRYGPEYVAPVALFLASDLGRDITGKILGIEGPHLFEYRVERSDGVALESEAPWTADQIRERWNEILGDQG